MHERIDALGKPVMEKAQAWAKDAGHEADATSLLTGDTTESILGYAEQNGVDLIVSESRGLGNLRGLLQGEYLAVANCAFVLSRSDGQINDLVQMSERRSDGVFIAVLMPRLTFGGRCQANARAAAGVSNSKSRLRPLGEVPTGACLSGGCPDA
ncbi:universal stress protein [Primorskyibacter marinus]|uniref:universal stress protein n=1 Tax=Primorskyibacter marinus TaxID=1977320 RepID=UPI000E303A93|nr:universal stress protein [Primorskyibacter marinus]